MTCQEAARDLAARLIDGDPELRAHVSECASCRREADSLEATLRALRPLAVEDAVKTDDLFVAAVRRRHAERVVERARGRWRLPAVTMGLAAAAALLALFGPRLLASHQNASTAHIEHALDADSPDDEDASELIGELDHEELARLADYGKGS